MKTRHLSLAALLAFLFVPLAYLHVLWHFARTGDGFMLKHLFVSPRFWLTLIGCIAVGIGLGRGSALAWLAGLLGAAWLLYPRVVAAIETLGHGFPVLPLGVTLAVLIAFILLLLTSPPRRIL